MSNFPQLHQGFPVQRPRRLRRDAFTRRLVRENTLSVDDLIYPVFVHDENRPNQAVPSMPGVERQGLDASPETAEPGPLKHLTLPTQRGA